MELNTSQPLIVAMVSASDGDHHLFYKLQQLFKHYGVKFFHIGWDRLNLKPDCFQEDGTEHRYLQHGWGFSNKKLLLAIPLWFIRLVLFLIFQLKADLIYVSELDSSLAVALIAPLRKIPFIYDIRDNFALRHPWPGWIKAFIEYLDNFVMQRAKAIIVVDDNRIIGPVARHREKVMVIYNCPEDFSQNGEWQQFPQPPEPFTILASGLLRENRGIRHLIEATRGMPGVRILMAGRFNEPWLEILALSCPEVRYLGWLPRKDALRLCFQSHIVFSMYDPVDEINRRAASNKWFDAMMAGRPILTNKGVLRSDWIREQGIGYICNYGDLVGLQQLIKHLQTNPEEAQAKGRRGRVLYEQEFNWLKMEQNLISVLSRVLSSANKTSPFTGNQVRPLSATRVIVESQDELISS